MPGPATAHSAITALRGQHHLTHIQVAMVVLLLVAVVVVVVMLLVVVVVLLLLVVQTEGCGEGAVVVTSWGPRKGWLLRC